jgi:hypothetical protein
MNAKTINPALGVDSFSCPSCGALSHQDWYNVHCDLFKKDNKPWIPDAETPERILKDKDINPAMRNSLADHFRQRLLQLPFFEPHEQNTWVSLSLENVYVSKCYSCKALAV